MNIPNEAIDVIVVIISYVGGLITKWLTSKKK